MGPLKLDCMHCSCICQTTKLSIRAGDGRSARTLTYFPASPCAVLVAAPINIARNERLFRAQPQR